MSAQSDQPLASFHVVAQRALADGEVPVLSSEQLFRFGSTVCIAHQGQCYTLRLTRENKLILTK